MERDERLRQRYQEVLQELETALSWLERPTVECGYVSDAQRSGFAGWTSRGTAGGEAGRPAPRIGFSSLFDIIPQRIAAMPKEDVGSPGLAASWIRRQGAGQEELKLDCRRFVRPI